jgi:Putative prokaryotic signal transducing protein
MKPLHTARHVTEAHLIRGYLESQGIATVVRGEYLTGGIGELPADLCKVWVIDDSDFARADDLLQQFLQGEAARTHAHERWHCANCGENLEGQFTDCWNCGASRPHV